MREIKADLSNLDEIISKQYEDKIRGFAKDSVQNSWEARLNRKKGTDFKMNFEFYEELDGLSNVLVLEDFGTVGMDNERWKAFHSHWVTTKGDYKGGIGRWGQGKALFLYLSDTNRILTESIDNKDNKYKYSIRTNTGYIQIGDNIEKGDPDWMKNEDDTLKQISDFFPSISPLNHSGTRICILEVREELVQEIINGYLEKQLSESWWELIKNYDIKVNMRIIRKNCIMPPFKKIDVPNFPETEENHIQTDISVGETHGKIRKLKIIIAKEIIPPSLRGIAIQRGRMTVCRYDLPSSVPDEIKEKTYGYCLMDELLDEEMWDIELANHEGFESRKAIWVNLRKKIDDYANKCLSKYIRTQKISPPPINVEEIIRTVNKLVDEHLEGLGEGGGGNGGGGNSNPPPLIRISPWGYLSTEKRFDSGDILEIKCGIENNTDKKVSIDFRYWVENTAGVEYLSEELKKIQIEPKEKIKLNLSNIEFSKIDLKKGKYLLKARLDSKNPKIWHERSSVFYFEQDPPTAGGWLKKLLFMPVRGPKKNLRNLPINSKGELLINVEYPEIDLIKNSSSFSTRQKAKELGPIVINIALQEAIREVNIKWWSDDKIVYDIEQIKKTKDLFDEMWANYLIGRNN